MLDHATRELRENADTVVGVFFCGTITADWKRGAFKGPAARTAAWPPVFPMRETDGPVICTLKSGRCRIPRASMAQAVPNAVVLDAVTGVRARPLPFPGHNDLISFGIIVAFDTAKMVQVKLAWNK
jgi:hypothetical protein